MATSFTADEIAAIRKFFAWVKQEHWLDGYRDGLTDADDEGVTVTEYSDDGYGGKEKDTSNIPWLALSDPVAYSDQLKAEEAARRREEAASAAEYRRQLEAQERAAYEALKRKYG